MKTIPIILFLAIHISRPVFGGIMQEKSSRAQEGTGRAESSKVIKYYFAHDIDKTLKELFLKTARAWEKDTCVEFKEKKGGPELAVDSTIFVYGDNEKDFDCSFNESPNEGGDHLLSVGCGYFGGAAHEVGHALGLIHTHTRYDRDAYLIVNSTNVEREYRENYQDQIKGRKESDVKRQIEKYEEVQYGKSKIMSDYYGVPYDYGSIMHYGTADTNPPMIPTDKDHKRTMGSQFISFLDLLEVNKRYDCLEKCSDNEETVACEHQGYPNPKNCSACVCPSGYGGRSCGDRPGNCGKDLTADGGWKREVLKISSPQNSSEYHICTSWIKTAPGTTIEIEIEDISDDLKTYGCGYAAVEIKTQDDERLTGYRFCSKDDKGVQLQSKKSPVPIITYSMTTAPLHVTLKYRSVSTKA